MDSVSDSLILSYKDNPELQAALGDLQPGDKVTLSVTVTVRANDKDQFDSLIDEVEPSADADAASEPDADEMPPEEDAAEGESADKPAAVMLVLGKKKGDASK